MSSTVVIELSPQAAALLRAAPQWPQAMARAIAAGMDRENELTIGHAQRLKLSQRGPTTLGVVTNRLRSSLNRSPAEVSGNSVTSTIGSNVSYARAHEFGFDGNVTVRAHTRRVFSYGGTGTKTFKQLTRDGRIVTKTRKPKATTGTVQVRSFQRHLVVKQRSFIRSSLIERAPDYGRTLSRGIVSAFRNPLAS